MGMFGWSYPAGAANDPSAPYNQTDEPIDLTDDCTLKGYGRRQHGLNGKDADCDRCGQIEIKTAWLWEDHIDIDGVMYATIGIIEESTEAEKDIQTEIICGTWIEGYWDESSAWDLNQKFSLRVPYAWNDAKTDEENIEAATKAAYEAVRNEAKPFEQELGWLHDGFDEIYKAVERREKRREARERRATKKASTK